ncbi:MAG: phosphodiester glycosidase family protein [Alkalispirochaetaceae bacterium]
MRALLFFLTLLLLLSSCQTLIPSPETEISPPPRAAWRIEELAPGAELLEYQGPETELSGEATYVTGGGGGLSLGLTIPTGKRPKLPQLPRIQAAALILDRGEAELVAVAEPPRRVSRRGTSERDGEALALRPSIFLRDHPEYIAAINATPFDPNVVSVGKPVDPIGVVLVEGRRLSDYEPRYEALYLPERGAPVIGPQPPERDAPTLRGALGGYFRVLREGVPEGPRQLRSARSAVGISEDGRQVIILAVAGDSPGRSVGLTAWEVGLWLESLGAWQGLVLDGGGSSSLAVREPGESVRMTITTSWGPTLGVERPVATLLAVRPK